MVSVVPVPTRADVGMGSSAAQLLAGPVLSPAHSSGSLPQKRGGSQQPAPSNASRLQAQSKSRWLLTVV